MNGRGRDMCMCERANNARTVQTVIHAQYSVRAARTTDPRVPIWYLNQKHAICEKLLIPLNNSM